MLYRYTPSNNWVRGTAFPRSPNLVFQQSHDLPVVRVTGAGVQVQKQIRSLQHPQIYYAQTAALAGYGGLSAGMIYGYQLSLNPLGQPAQNIA